MKKLLKFLGVMAGTYIVLDIGFLFGSGFLYELYEYPESRIGCEKKANDVIEAAGMANKVMFRHKNKNKKSSIKRSEVLSAHARKWAKEGYSSEEIKRGLDALRKELD